MFVSFEGIDGSGKSTLARRIAARLRREGHSVIEVREPGGTALGESIRALLLSPQTVITPRAEVLLFSAARAHLVDTVVRPALDRGDIVIADRFFDSTTAYQGRGRGVMDWMEADAINAFAAGSLKPDITFFLDVEPLLAASRRGSNSPDRIEASGDGFFAIVRQAYRQIAQRASSRVVTLDGRQSPEELEEAVVKVLEQRGRAQTK